MRLTATTVEILVNNDRHWLHARSYVRGRYTTVAEHMPKAHRAHAEWTPSRLIRWGSTVGPQTAQLVRQIQQHRPHPERRGGRASAPRGDLVLRDGAPAETVFALMRGAGSEQAQE